MAKYMTKDASNLPTLKKIFIGFFVYSSVVALFVQFYLLPVLIPDMHSSHGLMVSGDWNFFHDVARRLAVDMEQYGFKKWNVHPNGQGPAGILALHYWATGIHYPYVLIPLNALMHASAALILFNIIQLLFSSRRASLISSILYLTLPLSVLFYAQISKEVYYNLSLLLFVYSGIGVIKIVTSEKFLIKKDIRAIFFYFLLFSTSVVLVYICRPHIFLFYEGGVYLLCFFMMVGIIGSRKYIFSRCILVVMWAALSIALIKSFPHSDPGDLFSVQAFNDVKVENNEVVTKTVSMTNMTSMSDSPTVDRSSIELTRISPWIVSDYLLDGIDRKLSQLYAYREYFYRYTNGFTTVDREIRLDSALSMVEYFPRALMHGLFSPTYKFLGAGNSGQLSVFLTATAVIMLVLAIPVIFSIFGIYAERKNVLMWFVLVFALFYLLYPVYAFPNIGAFMRHRYVPHLIIVSIGIFKMVSLYYMSSDKKS